MFGNKEKTPYICIINNALLNLKKSKSWKISQQQQKQN